LTDKHKRGTKREQTMNGARTLGEQTMNTPGTHREQTGNAQFGLHKKEFPFIM
tara:strand:- start:710 stop:868 length:159 start_codon:yes stop_codon:yes gene_type:complete